MKSFYLWLAFLSLFALGLVDSGRGPVFPDLLEEFALSDTKGALFFSLTSLFACVNNLLATRWLSRFGAYRSFQTFLVLQTVAALIIGFSTSFYGALIGAALLGIAMGGLGITQNIIVGQTAAPSSQRRAFGFLHSMYGASSFAAPVLISAVYSAGLSWRNAFLFLAFPTVVLLVATLIKPALQKIEAAESPRYKLTSSERRVVVWFAATIMLYVLTELLVSTRLVLYMRRDYGLEPQAANAYLAWFFGLMLFGRLSPFIFPATISTMKIMRYTAIASLVLLVLGLFHDPKWLVASGLTMAPLFPAAMSYIQEEFGAIREPAFSWLFSLHALGTMSMHWFTGVLTDHFGLRFALGIGPVALAIVVISLHFPLRVPSK